MKFRKIALWGVLLLCLLPVTVAGAANDDIVRLGVMRFSSKATNVSDAQAEIITDIFTRVMSNSKSIALIERERLDMIGKEHKLNMSGLVDMGMAVEVGRLAGCQYMIMGSVTGLNEGVSGGGFAGIVSGSRVAEATIDMRIVDVTTTEIVLSLVQTGSSAQQATAVAFQGLTWAEADLSDVKARAVADAAVRLGHRIREELVGEYSQVLQVSGKSVNINVGATSGAQKGDLYLIYSDGPEIHDIDGTPLGREKHPIAVVKVVTVQSGFSTCEVASGGGDLSLAQRGDKIEPISSKDSRELSRQKRFVKERPRLRDYQKTAAQIFGSDEGLISNQAASTDGPAENVVNEPAPVESAYAEPEPASASGGLAASRASSNQNFENVSTNPAKVINTYPLDPGKRNLRRVEHLNARKQRRIQAVYDAYVALVESYSGDYLAAYQAGETARRMRKNDDAKAWYDKALAINPNYEPAVKARARMK